MSDHIQSPEMIRPLAASSGPENQQLKPGQEDYKLGRNYLTKGDYPAAAIAFHNALKIFEEVNDQPGIANAADRLGDVCLAKGQYQLAIDNYQRARAICVAENDSFSVVSLDKKIASACRELGNYPAALNALFEMVEHYRLTRNPKSMVETLERIAQVYAVMGEKSKEADTYRTLAAIHANFSHQALAEEYTQRASRLEQQ